MLKLFRNRLFSTFFFSRSLANVADSIYMIVVLWLVQTTTHNTIYTSIAYALVSVSMLFSFLYGPLLDRFSPSKLAGIALFVQAVVVFFLPLVENNVVLMLGLLFIASLFSALYYPANNTILPRLLDNKDDLFAGNSLVSSSDEVTNVLSFLLGGSIIAIIGNHNTMYLSAGLLLLAGIIYIYLARSLKASAIVEESEGAVAGKSGIKAYGLELKEGIQYIAKHPLLKLLLPFFLLANFAFATVIVLIPSIGEQYGSAIYFSGIFVISLVGFVIGAILMNALKKSGTVLVLFWIGEGLSLILYYFLPEGFWWKGVAILLFGICTGVTTVLLTSFIQLTTPESMMGRVMATIPSLANMAVPLGSLIGGVLARFLAAEVIFLMGGILMTLTAIAMFSTRAIRVFDADKLESSMFERREREGIASSSL